jgi:ubiquinone/menaquinone biosynthesis C-methylase UbiE
MMVWMMMMMMMVCPRCRQVYKRFPHFYDSVYTRFETRGFTDCVRAAVHRWRDQHPDNDQPMRVLDFACGTGQVSPHHIHSLGTGPG